MGRCVVLLLVLAAPGCVQVYRSVRATPLDVGSPITVTAPVKAHLIDGSTVVFDSGVTVQGDSVRGLGMRYTLTLKDSTVVRGLSLDSIVGMETFEQTTDDARGAIMTVLATAGGVALAGVLAVAIFGSCPTIYADSAGTTYLQAEGFSYSIASIFESRDVDRLRVTPSPDGSVRLEVRNEALETHYLNQLELLDVTHAEDETALVDELNRLVAVSDVVPLARARSRDGRSVLRTLSAHDGDVYHTDRQVMRRGRVGNLDDWIDVSALVPAGVDTVAVVLRVRNSLLNTTLLYDVMLGDAGARSLDWVGKDLKQVGPALAVAQWYQERMGLYVAVHDGREYRRAAHLRDTGPIAWKDVAVIVPVLARDTLHLRLSFPMDNWRIDRIAIATRMRRVTPAVVALADVSHGDGTRDSAALLSLRHADSRYLQTSPGQHFVAAFRPSRGPAQARTFFLAAQGYYTEWMRSEWLRSPRSDRVFEPSETALAQALARWRGAQDSLEALFAASRIPVR